MSLFALVGNRYESPQHIMEEFVTLRSEFYGRRKTSLLNKLQSEWSKLDNKVIDGGECGIVIMLPLL